MEKQSVLELMRNWGYYLLPKSHDDSPGYTGLLVAIRKEPTGQHFDPQTLHLHLQDEGRVLRERKLSCLTPLTKAAQVCAGHIILRDRAEKAVEFFSFGGTLDVLAEPGEHIYTLRSPAPVLELDAHETIANLLASETESLMAKAEAKWGRDEDGFNRRLVDVDPLLFYLTAVHSILLHYDHAPALERASHGFYEGLLKEKGWLAAEGHWSTGLSTLEDLLAPH